MIVDKTTRERLPQYYAIFIVASLLPQILGFNGSALDTIWKLLVVGSLILMAHKSFTSYSIYSLAYIFISLICQLCTVIFSNESLSGLVINTVFTALMIIVFYNYPSQVKRISLDDILLFYKIFVYFIVISCLYNMIIHPSKVMTITTISVYGSEDICSFFDNKNTFGVFLLFASLAAVILKYYTKQIRWTLLLGLIIINELMAACRTALVISFALLVASLLISKSGITVKRVIVTILVIILIFALLNNIGVFHTMFEELFSSEDSMEERNNYITSMKPLIKGIHAIVGYGNDTAPRLAYQYTGNRYFHNTYLYILIVSGIVGLLLFASVLFISIKTAIKIGRHDKATALLCALSYAVYLVYAYVESAVLFDTPVISMVATIFVVSMPSLFLKAFSSKTHEEDIAV